jgi:hypothetical protein
MYKVCHLFPFFIKNVLRPTAYLSSGSVLDSGFGSGLDSGSVLGSEIGSGSVTAMTDSEHYRLVQKITRLMVWFPIDSWTDRELVPVSVPSPDRQWAPDRPPSDHGICSD